MTEIEKINSVYNDIHEYLDETIDMCMKEDNKREVIEYLKLKIKLMEIEYEEV